MRLSTIYILFTSTALMLFILMIFHASHRQHVAKPLRKEQAALVSRLQLTDLCLFSEARYTRHPSMADRFAPFQDFPGALEHFPSGSLVSPPDMRRYVKTP